MNGDVVKRERTLKKGEPYGLQGLGNLGPLKAVGPPGRPPSREHLYARALVRTVFGRPKARMFSGGMGTNPGGEPRVRSLTPQRAQPPNEGPHLLGFTRAGGGRTKRLRPLGDSPQLLSVGRPRPRGDEHSQAVAILAQDCVAIPACSAVTLMFTRCVSSGSRMFSTKSSTWHWWSRA